MSSVVIDEPVIIELYGQRCKHNNNMANQVVQVLLLPPSCDLSKPLPIHHKHMLRKGTGVQRETKKHFFTVHPLFIDHRGTERLFLFLAVE